MQIKLEEIVERIITVNHAWKLSKDEFGLDFVATNSLRDTKSSLQATLLREFPKDVYLRIASDSADHDESLYSVRLKQKLIVNGVVREDAEHLPARIAKQIFSPKELSQFLNS
ncbi:MULTISPECIES: hypothetical protein [Vibrio]|uniref:hypothetical protein n=1 Tax=Vibrio TaxID=662 RepID=UPI00237C736C|nr:MULTISPECIES: hypothetical protein [Vibrio]MDE1239235.1 hypothetical protein [Vibrio aestuarianus]MDE1339823.1 hypothetical protein [Vibrio aestuarianus]MDF9400374.1 hypothetical protein [Vibrio sp. 1180_3]